MRGALRQDDNYAKAASALVGMLGLGPGLTPSGDDLLAGIVAALVWQARLGSGQPHLARSLANAIKCTASRVTNHISARFLWHACEGVLYAPAFDVGAALLSGDTAGVKAALPRLLTVGHTTGADLAAGLLVGTLLLDKGD